MHHRVATSVARQKRLIAATARPSVISVINAPKMLTAPEVCEYLRVSRGTLYRLFRDHEIPAFRVSKRDWRVAVADLAQWVERESRAWKVGTKA